MKIILLLTLAMAGSLPAGAEDPAPAIPPTTNEIVQLGKASDADTEIGGFLPNGTRVVRNVNHPTLTVFPADPAKANGTAVIIAPGGGFRFLSIDSEGNDVAKYLSGLGITSFVLKYRTINTSNHSFDLPRGTPPTPELWNAFFAKVSPGVLEDGQAAVRYVRQHAAHDHLDPHRIGLMGFSAGGYVALMTTLHHDAESRPDFAMPIYPLAPQEIAPKEQIPLFLLCADDDTTLSPVDHSVRVYEAWHAARMPVELHILTKGGHGFGMKKTGNSTDAWTDLLTAWLRAQKLLDPAP